MKSNRGSTNSHMYLNLAQPQSALLFESLPHLLWQLLVTHQVAKSEPTLTLTQYAR